MNQTNIVFYDFKTYQLSEPSSQKKLLAYTSWLMATSACVSRGITSSVESEKLFSEAKDAVNKYGVSADLIHQRQFSIAPDNWEEATTVTGRLPSSHANLLNDPKGELLNDRMAIYQKKSKQVFEFFYANESSPPDDIIHVTCAGYLSPSAAQTYAVQRDWLDTQITHSYHMGCYGAFPAIRMATGFLVASHHSLVKKKHKIDIVHTEFLSTHLNITDTDPNNIVNMTLFADGFIKYSACPEHVFSKQRTSGLKLLASLERLIPESLDEMTWIPGPYQFDMYLSKNVPVFIRNNVGHFIVDLCSQLGINFHEEKSNLIFALHPGGPKILNHIQEVLDLTDKQIKFSRAVFTNNGNMSSATVPHILKMILESDEVKKNTKIISLGFGPGLTATGLVFEKL